MTAHDLINFELRIRRLFAEGKLPYLIHLCGGNEIQLIQIFNEIHPQDWVFSTHRSHYHYLLHGGDPDTLEQMIREGRSMFVFDRRRNFYSSSVLAGTCGIAAGVAQTLAESGSKQKVWCFLGDGAEDEGHFYEAVNYVDGKNLPCSFIIEDNDRSVDSSKSQRGRGRVVWPPCVRRYHYVPEYPHGGVGLKEMVAFDPRIRPVWDDIGG
jgi:TPP-dependent pyruvate/acetoin dehydrogenase alpha subunit